MTAEWSARLSTCVAGLLLLSQPAVGQERPEAYRGATLIDGTTKAPVADATVVIHRGIIVAAGPSATTPIPPGAHLRDVRGRWIVPGFVDMHSHLAAGAWAQTRTGLEYRSDTAATTILAAKYPAFGVTGVRNPAGPAMLAVELRNRIRDGRLAGPWVFSAGAPLDAVTQKNAQVGVTSDADVEREIEQQARLGVDFIKLYAGLRPPLVQAAVRAAHRRGLPVLLHPWLTSWSAAVSAGVDGLTHISPGAADMLAPERREEFGRSFRGTQFLFSWFRLADFNDPRVLDVIDAMAARGVALDPTLVAMEQLAWSDTPTHYSVAARQVLPPGFREAPPATDILTVGWTPEDFRSAKAQWPRILAFTKLLADRGVVLTVGTDGANPWFFHRELELLVDAGIAPAEVLRMATRNAAIVLGRTSEFGTVEPGRRADFVLLRGDPLSDIRNSRDIEFVVQRGRRVEADPCVRARVGACLGETRAAPKRRGVRTPSPVHR